MVLCFFFRRIIMRFFSVHIYLRICDWLLNLLWIDPWFTINPTFLVSPISNRNQFRHAKETHFAPSSFTSTTALMTPPPKKKRHKPTTSTTSQFFCLFFPLCVFVVWVPWLFEDPHPPKEQKNTWPHLDPFFSPKYLSILIKYQKELNICIF